ncbi:MAG: hypothetical protein WBF93_13140 [Pirellulales bacterium]
MSRHIAFFCGGAYSIFLIDIIRTSTLHSLGIAALLVVTGMAIQVAILMVLALRLVRQRKPRLQFSLATVSLIFVWISTYFAPFRWLWKAVEARAFVMGRTARFAEFTLMFLFISFVSVVVLPYFAESILYAALRVQRAFRGSNRHPERKLRAERDAGYQDEVAERAIDDRER